MALIIRIDVDRPYGRRPFLRHYLSRLSSDLYYPRVERFGFLEELTIMLNWLNEARARAHVFFRRCTLHSPSILKLLDSGRHEIGLHLENSRSLTTFLEERQIIERHVGRKVRVVSKHGSGGSKYVEWAQQASMRMFLGNLEDPTLQPNKTASGLLIFPSAFWLEPPWRDTHKFTVDWLRHHAKHNDVVLLVHPENVLASPELVSDFKRLVETLESRVF